MSKNVNSAAKKKNCIFNIWNIKKKKKKMSNIMNTKKFRAVMRWFSELPIQKKCHRKRFCAQ